MRVYRKAPKMQMRFTLQATTPDAPKWRKVALEDFSEWITAPATSASTRTTRPCRTCSRPRATGRSSTSAGATARGKTIRTERAISPVCKQPDARPDLVLRNVRVEDGSYVGVIFNRGREAAGPFAVDFLRRRVVGRHGRGHGPGSADADHRDDARAEGAVRGRDAVEVVADARAQVDEADEENNAFSAL